MKYDQEMLRFVSRDATPSLPFHELRRHIPLQNDKQMHKNIRFIQIAACMTMTTCCVFADIQTVPQNIVFPDSAKILNVVRDCGAVGDGKTDDTAALQKAYDSAGLIYLPNGIYLVSDSIIAPPRKGGAASRRILQGQSIDKTIIKLKDGSAGFSDAGKTKPMLKVSWGVAQAFRNGVRNMTFDSGSNNPGAVGVEFFASNQGGMHHVAIRSGDGKGAIGLQFTGDNGPMFAKDIHVTGFNVGILAQPNHDVVMEHVYLSGQGECGLVVDRGGKVFLRDLQSDNAVPAVRSGPREFVLLDAALKGGKSNAAIEVSSLALIRNVTTEGYANAIKDKSGTVPGPKVEEWTSAQPVSLFPSASRSLNLPVKETPEPAWDDLKDWADATGGAPGGKGPVDVTESFQKAIDSGAKTIFFPKGNWAFNDIHVRGKVRRIIGMESNIPVNKLKPRFIVEDGESPVVVIERFDMAYGKVEIEHASKRTLVVSSCIPEGLTCKPGSGDVFLEDVCMWRMDINGNHVWARQFDPEHSYNADTEPNPRPNVDNKGGTFWLFGLKTEQNRTKVTTRNGGKTEAYAYILANRASNPVPMFIVENSMFSMTVVEDVLRKAPFEIIVRETRGGEMKELKKGSGGCGIPLFVGYR